jgi:hypothetical protein
MIDLEVRKYWKKQFIRKRNAKPHHVTFAVVNIYESEFGHLFDDEEASKGLTHRIASLAEKHQAAARDYDELVDLVLEEMHREDAEAAKQALH